MDFNPPKLGSEIQETIQGKSYTYIRQIDTQIDRQAERQKDRQIERQKNRKIDRQIDRMDFNHPSLDSEIQEIIQGKNYILDRQIDI